MFPALECRLLNTGPSGKSLASLFGINPLSFHVLLVSIFGLISLYGFFFPHPDSRIKFEPVF